MRLLFLCCMSLLATSCATTDNGVSAGVQTRDVYVPVVEKCVKRADVPVPPRAAIPPGADAGQEAKAVSAYARSARIYIARADVLLRKCAED
jgi:hypothetical protein